MWVLLGLLREWTLRMSLWSSPLKSEICWLNFKRISSEAWWGKHAWILLWQAEYSITSKFQKRTKIPSRTWRSASVSLATTGCPAIRRKDTKLCSSSGRCARLAHIQCPSTATIQMVTAMLFLGSGCCVMPLSQHAPPMHWPIEPPHSPWFNPLPLATSSFF